MKKIFLIFLAYVFTVINVNAQDLRFVQVTDLLYNPNNQTSISEFDELIQKINNEKNVEFVIFTGNNISKPNQEYLAKFVNTANKLKRPYYVTIGNKDVSKQKDFGKNEYFKYLKKKVSAHKKIKTPNYSFEKKKVVFIVPEGAKEVIPGTYGYYRPETLSWLNKTLAQCKHKHKKAVIIQHFPVVMPEDKELLNTYKPEKYLEITDRYSIILAVISGHFNSAKEIERNNVMHISTPNAPKYKIIDVLEYDTDNPVIWTTLSF